MQAIAFLKSLIRSGVLGCLHLYHLECCNAYVVNNTFEPVFSSLEVEASLRSLLRSMVGWEGNVTASVLQVMQ